MVRAGILKGDGQVQGGKIRTSTTTTTTTEFVREEEEEEEEDEEVDSTDEGISDVEIAGLAIGTTLLFLFFLSFIVAYLLRDRVAFLSRCFRTGGNSSTAEEGPVSYDHLLQQAARHAEEERRREMGDPGDMELVSLGGGRGEGEGEEEEEDVQAARQKKGKGKKSAVGGVGGGEGRRVSSASSAVTSPEPGPSTSSSIIIAGTKPELRTPGGGILYSTFAKRVPVPAPSTSIYKPPTLKVKVAQVRDDVPAQEGIFPFSPLLEEDEEEGGHVNPLIRGESEEEEEDQGRRVGRSTFFA